MKVTLFLMTKKGLKVLKAIIKAFGPAVVDKVCVSRDKNVQKDYFDEICEVCDKNEIPCFDKGAFSGIETEYVFAISWRWVINTDCKVVVLHDSILPGYSGWAPLINALINHEEEVGVTAFLASDKIDSGTVVAREKLKLDYPVKIEQAIDLIIPYYCKICLSLIDSLMNEGFISQLDERKVKRSYSMWLDDFDYFIDWRWKAGQIVNFINAVGFPYLGAQSDVMLSDGRVRRVKVLNGEVCENIDIINRDRHLGKVFRIDNDQYVVVVGEGLVKLDLITDFNIGNIRIRFLNRGRI